MSRPDIALMRDRYPVGITWEEVERERKRKG